MSKPSHSLPAARPAVRPRTLFLAFSLMSLNGFGGVMPIAYRVMVEQRHWVEPAAFAEMMALAQILPGPPVCNVALMFGYRESGYAGALAAVAGLLLAPMIIVMALAMLYQRLGNLEFVRQALAGMSAVAAGLVLSMAIKMAKVMPRRLPPLILMVLAGLGVGLMHWPLVLVLGVLSPVAIWLAWKVDVGREAVPPIAPDATGGGAALQAHIQTDMQASAETAAHDQQEPS